MADFSQHDYVTTIHDLRLPSGFREDAAAKPPPVARRSRPADPLVAFNDLLAIGALRAAAARGFDVPAS